MTIHTLVADVECYRNYFMVGFKSTSTGKVQVFEMYDGHPFDIKRVRSILLSYRIVTFNGLNYDLPMLTLALRGATCEELKVASDAIIIGNLRGWQFERQYDIKINPNIDHIDLSEVAPGVMVSLKQYGGRMHSRKLQDLPIEPDALITPAQRIELVAYNENDLDTTIDLWNKLTTGSDNVIAIRERIGAETGLELRSKSDAQVAEAVIRAQVEKLKCERIYRPEVAAGTCYKFRPAAFLHFTTPLLINTLAEICKADFIVKADGKVAEPPALTGRKFTIGSTTYAMGIGGLHSCEKSIMHMADADTVLVDRDVVSFYPMLIKQCGLSPRNMGHFFQSVYGAFIDRRIAAKKAGEKTVAQTLKIFLNGTFGKLGSHYSIVYAPDLLIQVTLTGQLVLLMMIERLELAGIPIVSANTDGIVIKCPRHLEQTMLDIVAQWERDTGFETEETRYRALCSRDINNYIALKEHGGYKAKGAFSAPGLQKNPQNMICNDAVAAALEHGSPIAETIYRCTDVRKFLTVRNVAGGGTYGDAYLGKVVRWVYRKGESRDIRYRKPNKTGGFNKVAGSDGAMPLMELPDSVPADIDYEWYIREANDILRDVGALQ